jgi:hypothetical protein
VDGSSAETQVSGGFEAALDAFAFELQTSGDFAGDGLDETRVDSRLLRLDRIEEELAAESDPDVVDRLLREARQLEAMLADESIVEWGDAVTVDERNELIHRRDAATRQTDRPGGTSYDPFPIALESAKEGARELRRLPVPGVLGADAAAVRRFVRARLETVGLDTDAHLRRPPRGKPTAEASAIRAALAPVVAAARAKGATLEALAAATNRTVSTVSELLQVANPKVSAPIGEGADTA